MNAKEKAARDRLARMNKENDTWVVDKSGGRHSDNHEGTETHSLLARITGRPPKRSRNG